MRRLRPRRCSAADTNPTTAAKPPAPKKPAARPPARQPGSGPAGCRAIDTNTSVVQLELPPRYPNSTLREIVLWSRAFSFESSHPRLESCKRWRCRA